MIRFIGIIFVVSWRGGGATPCSTCSPDEESIIVTTRPIAPDCSYCGKMDGSCPTDCVIQNTEIRFLSYNIFMRPPAPKFTHNVSDDHKDRRLNAFIQSYLNSYDIVCLQEMFGSFSHRRSRLIKAAQDRGFHWSVANPRAKNFLVDGGLLILSKVRIVAHAHTIFKPGVMSDRLSAKGAIYAKLEPSPGVFVHLFVTHLQAVYADAKSRPKCLRAQADQYEELVNFISSTVGGGIRQWPILVAGDFNCNSRIPRGSHARTSTEQFQKLSTALSRLGTFSDILFDQYGHHPVTYAYANFHPNGSFTPAELALTDPADYHPSGEHVNQSLDYIFLFPQQTRQAPVLTVARARVGHLRYIPGPQCPAAPNLKYLSDHLAVEAILRVASR